MKKILILMILLSSFSLAIWDDTRAAQNGWSKTIVCKEGFLYSIYTKTTFDKLQTIEQLTCYSVGGWNGGCEHTPILCKVKNKGKKMKASDIKEFQERKKKLKTISEFKTLGREMVSAFGITDKEAIALLNGKNELEILVKYEEPTEIKPSIQEDMVQNSASIKQ